MIALTVKTQARGKNEGSRVLKWGILCLCSYSSLGVTIEFVKKSVFIILHFCKKKLQNHNIKLQKVRKFKNWNYFLIISPILFELHSCTLPHFQAFDKLFWTLAWVLTQGAFIVLILRKVPVYFWDFRVVKISWCSRTWHLWAFYNSRKHISSTNL